ncbi:MAG: NADH-quinone oxidoreductase subunit NuoF [Sulfuricella sp.]
METPLTANIAPGREPLAREPYERSGGYRALRTALRMQPHEVVGTIKEAGLRGRGGAGFSTGTKWSLVPTGDAVPRPKYLIANADEMEPGTFKDRMLLEGDPHQLLEGMIIAAFAIEADIAYVFLRWEYRLAAQRLKQAIAECYAAGYLGADILGSGYSLDLYLHVSAGRYICGEETALLNALEGKRPNPRAKPPYPAVVGLFGKPTVVNNVETLCNVPHIVNNGAAWFAGLGRGGGTKLYGVSGRVKKPGLWELPMGTTIREILEEHAGGMRDGYVFRGLQPGGASTDFLLERHLDVAMDYDSVQQAGSRLGTGNMVVLDDRTCPVGMLLNLEHFFAQESCGWCTPCWAGLGWVERMLREIEEGRGRPEYLDQLAAHTRLLGPGRTFCAHAPGAMEPLQSGLLHFRDDFERHIREQRCPWR